MEAEALGMEPKTMMLSHLFCGDKKKQRPILRIELLVNPQGPDSGALIAHRWIGTGQATKKEFSQLIRHCQERGFDLIANYIETVVMD